MISATAKVDMHCHSTASERSKLGVQRSLGLPECATPPQQVYELAKRRGMDFVTITDHDTIDGCLELADRPDCFISEELTAWFPASRGPCTSSATGSRRRTTIGCRPIPATSSPAPPTFRSARSPPGSPTPSTRSRNHSSHRHRRRLAELFSIWEVRNGSRAPELNMPAAVYIDTHGGTGIGGSDDHAGVDIGRTFTETPAAGTPEEFLRLIRRGEAAQTGSRAAPPSGRTRRSRSECVPSADPPAGKSRLTDLGAEGAATRNEPEPASRPCLRLQDRRARDERGRRPQRGRQPRPRAGARPGAARSMAGVDGVRQRRGIDRPYAGGRLQPQRAGATGAANPRAGPRRRGDLRRRGGGSW